MRRGSNNGQTLNVNLLPFSTLMNVKQTTEVATRTPGASTPSDPSSASVTTASVETAKNVRTLTSVQMIPPSVKMESALMTR